MVNEQAAADDGHHGSQSLQSKSLSAKKSKSLKILQTDMNNRIDLKSYPEQWRN